MSKLREYEEAVEGAACMTGRTAPPRLRWLRRKYRHPYAMITVGSFRSDQRLPPPVFREGLCLCGCGKKGRPLLNRVDHARRIFKRLDAILAGLAPETWLTRRQMLVLMESGLLNNDEIFSLTEILEERNVRRLPRKIR